MVNQVQVLSASERGLATRLRAGQVVRRGDVREGVDLSVVMTSLESEGYLVVLTDDDKVYADAGSAIVLVDDGQYCWGARREQLQEALEGLGWQRVGPHRVEEPEVPEDSDPGEAYAALCARVDEVPGLEAGTVSADRHDELVEAGARVFRARPDWGPGAWSLLR